jgi:arginyl-tRNA synthetase
MNLFSEYRSRIVQAVDELCSSGVLPKDLDTSRVSVEPPREAEHGDLATNAAMVLAKQAGLKPRDLAEHIAEKLRADAQVTGVEIAGPGFINIRLEPAAWRAVLAEVLAQGDAFGASEFGAGKKVNIEYVSANPTGPLHIGHARGTVFGDALASLLEKAGFEVCREYYINDAGAQVDALARSVYLRYREALGETIGEIPEGLYPGDYLIPVGQALAVRDGDRWITAPEEEWLAPIRQFAIDAMMDLIRDDLATLDVRHDVFTSERSLVEAGRVDEVLENLTARDLIYTGVLEPPKGKKPDDWEPRPQTLFRATDFRDDVDRPLKKSDGSWTYFASDIAYHRDKYLRGFSELIDVWGADHGGYVKRMVAATDAVTEGAARLDVKICQIVRLLEKGEQVRMSKRSGHFVTLRDLVDEVGPGVVRFIMLTRKNDAPLDFDLAVVREQSRENPVFYVQYAHARCHSVMRMAAEALSDLPTDTEALASADLSLLQDEAELELIKFIALWPRTVESAAEAHEPHRLAFYMYDLASAFHSLWTKGSREDPSLRMVRDDSVELTRARLALARATQIVIASGLSIFGVEAVEEMR